jgi:uncharacterized protein with HEPN domain
MPRAPSDHLRDALEAIDAILEYTREGEAAFQREPMVRDAVCARLIQIGQAVKDAQTEGLELSRMQPDIPWRSVAGMRDRLAHKYALLDKVLVWAVVERELPRLRQAVRAILSRS